MFNSYFYKGLSVSRWNDYEGLFRIHYPSGVYELVSLRCCKWGEVNSKLFYQAESTEEPLIPAYFKRIEFLRLIKYRTTRCILKGNPQRVNILKTMIGQWKDYTL